MSPNFDISADVALFSQTHILFCNKKSLHCNFLFKSKKFWGLFCLLVFFCIFFSVAKWDAVGRVLPNLLLHRDYHQRVKPANHCEHPITWLILMDNLIRMRWRTLMQREWQNMLHHPSATMIFLAMSWMITFRCLLLTCTPASLTGGNSTVIPFPT